MINLLKADGRRLKLLVSVNLLSLENINPSAAGPELPPPHGHTSTAELSGAAPAARVGAAQMFYLHF